MFEFILANLLFQASAGVALFLFAAGSAAKDMLRKRPGSVQSPAISSTAIVVDLPAPRAHKVIPAAEIEKQAEAA